MREFLSEEEEMKPGDALTAVIFILFFIGLMVAEVLTNFQPIKLSGLLVTVFWIPLLALHEAFHAIAAWICGWKVNLIVVGMGKTLYRFSIKTTQVEIRLFPVSGFVQCYPLNQIFPRIKEALIYFAGPGIELFIALAILFSLGVERCFSIENNYFLITFQSLAIAAGAGAVTNLFPLTIQTKLGEIPNDGLGLMLSFFRPDDYFKAKEEWGKIKGKGL